MRYCGAMSISRRPARRRCVGSGFRRRDRKNFRERCRFCGCPFVVSAECGNDSKEVIMRRVVVSEFVSLDSVVEDPQWTFQFGSDEQEEFKFDKLAASDALLLGRVTYEGFAAAWPQMEEQTGEYGA